MQRLSKKRPMKKDRREIRKILCYGKQLSRMNLFGIPPGEKEDQDGI